MEQEKSAFRQDEVTGAGDPPPDKPPEDLGADLDAELAPAAVFVEPEPEPLRQMLVDEAGVLQEVLPEPPTHRVSVLYASGTPPVTRARCEVCGDLEFAVGEDIARRFNEVAARSKGGTARHVLVT